MPGGNLRCQVSLHEWCVVGKTEVNFRAIQLHAQAGRRGGFIVSRRSDGEA